MSYYTSTTTRTETSIYTDVKNVIWKIKSDLFQIRYFHKRFDETYENQLATDLFCWTYSNYCSGFKFTFFDPITQQCAFELRYKVTIGTGTITTNDDAGRIQFKPLSNKTFRVFVTTNSLWDELLDVRKQAFYRRLNLSWGPSSQNISYSHGSWINDKVYSSNQVSAARSVFMGV